MHVLNPTTTFPETEELYWGPFLYKLFESIEREGVDVEVLTGRTPETEDIKADFEINRFNWFLSPRFQTLVTPPGLLPNIKNHPWRLTQLPFYYLSLARAVRQNSKTADIIHAHWLIPSGFAAVRNTSKPVLVTAHGADYHVNPEGVLGNLVKRAQKRADKIVAVSEHLKRKGVEEFGCPEDKITVIPNAVDTEEFNPERESSIRDDLDISKDEPIVATARRLVGEKRVEDFVRAAGKVSEDVDDVKFVIAGGGPKKDELESLSENLGLEDQVLFTGILPREKIPELLSEAEIFGMTSEQEGMSVALLEAMAAGSVPVATRAVGNDEVIVDGKNGLMYETGDIEELSECILELLRDDNERDYMSKEARGTMEDNHSYEAAADKYIELYKELV